MAKPPAKAGKASAKPKALRQQDHDQFREAVLAGRLEKVKQLLERGYDPSSNKSGALRLALSSGFPRIAELLVERGARVGDVSAELFWSATVNRRPMEWQIDFVLARIDGTMLTPHNLIASVSQPKALKALLKAGANPNGWAAVREGGEMLTPLIAAVQDAYVESAIALLDAGADPNCLVAQRKCIYSEGRATMVAAPPKSILHVAVQRPHLHPVVKRLIEAGANLDFLCGSDSPLRHAIVVDAQESAALLLRGGADPDLSDVPRAVVQLGKWGAVPHLLRAGARFPSPLPPSWGGRIPLEVLGLFLRAGVELTVTELVRLTRPEVPLNTPVETLLAMGLAQASLVYPDFLPQKLL